MPADRIAQLAQVRLDAGSGRAKSLRLTRLLSLADIAESCRVSQSTVWRWENGVRRPRGEAALRYAALLEELREVA